jgi:hypothetical protein
MSSYTKGLLIGLPVGVVLYFVVVFALKWGGSLPLMMDW